MLLSDAKETLGRAVRAVVADDELSAREVIRSFVAREPGIEIVAEAANGIEAIEHVRTLKPDLLFLDVQMPDQDGFGVLADLGDDVPRGVVLVTAHDEYALRAFDVHALDYLLKPFGFARFQEAMRRVLRSLAGDAALEMRSTVQALVEGQRARFSEAGMLTEGVAPKSGAPDRIGVRKGPRTILVDVPGIDWVEAADDYCRLHVGSERHLVTARMHEIETRLGPRFLRIHRSSIVNLESVVEVRHDPDGGGVAVLTDGVRLRVSRSRWTELQEALGI